MSGSSGERVRRTVGWARAVMAGLGAVSIAVTAACAAAGSAGAPAAVGGRASRPAVGNSGRVVVPPPRTPSPGALGPCPGGTVKFVHHPGDPWSAKLCVSVGAQLKITLLAARGYRWTIVESTDPAVAAVTGSVILADGAAEATVHARGAGTVELRASTSFTADPFGPPTRLWRLTLRITP